MLVMLWSIRVAEWDEMRVGLVMVCRKPDENNESRYEDEWLGELSLRRSILRSPEMMVGMDESEDERMLRRISLNWSNCSDVVSVRNLDGGR